MTRRPTMAHLPERPSRLRKIVDVACFFVAVVVIVLVLSVDNVH